ncbi:RCC1 domain-containing protein [Fusibacter bizertensis]
MNFLGIVVTIGSLIGAVAYFLKDKEEIPIDAYKDYEVFLNAMTEYKNNHSDYAKDIRKLLPFMSNPEKMNLKRYGLSLDGKFLTVSHLPEEEAQKLINEIGGDSYINGVYTYLTLRRMNDLSEIKPIAHFSMKPDNKFSTTTFITYETSGCIAENGEILERKWENKFATFKEPGIYTIRLKIRDKNNNWSDTFEREIKVVEEKGIRDIEAYDGSFFMLYKNGRCLSRGKNESGQLGIGSLNPVNDLKYNSMYDSVLQIACGEGFNVFKFHDGSVGTAGSNRYGELATGDKNAQKTITSVWGLENIKQVSAGRKFAAALDYEGNVFVWGDNSDGQLMQDEVQDSMLPIKLEGVTGIKQISCGANFGLALKYDGTVMAWGDNTHGQLSVGYKGSVSEPVVTLFSNVKSVHAGDKYSLVVTDSGKVFGCGNNAYGQLGTKGKSEIFFPTEVLRLKDVETLKVRDSLTLAVMKTGKIYVWGNFNGPGNKPMYDPVEITGINYAKAFANNGKKCFVIDSNNDFFVISDLSGKYDKKKMFENFYEFMENESSKVK